MFRESKLLCISSDNFENFFWATVSRKILTENCGNYDLKIFIKLLKYNYNNKILSFEKGKEYTILESGISYISYVFIIYLDTFFIFIKGKIQIISI